MNSSTLSRVPTGMTRCVARSQPPSYNPYSDEHASLHARRTNNLGQATESSPWNRCPSLHPSRESYRVREFPRHTQIRHRVCSIGDKPPIRPIRVVVDRGDEECPGNPCGPPTLRWGRAISPRADSSCSSPRVIRGRGKILP